jgi:hypothetical protein
MTVYTGRSTLNLQQFGTNSAPIAVISCSNGGAKTPSASSTSWSIPGSSYSTRSSTSSTATLRSVHPQLLVSLSPCVRSPPTSPARPSATDPPHDQPRPCTEFNRGRGIGSVRGRAADFASVLSHARSHSSVSPRPTPASPGVDS